MASYRRIAIPGRVICQSLIETSLNQSWFYDPKKNVARKKEKILHGTLKRDQLQQKLEYDRLNK